jgi:PleD family two-component response regulator
MVAVAARFAVVLPETDADRASRVAERVLQAAAPSRSAVAQPQDLTVSIGVASVHGRGAAG